MKKFWASPLFRGRWLLAIASGLLLAASFPRVSIAGLAWIAPGLMVAAALGREGGDRFRLGYLSALTYYLASLSWLLLIPYRWHGVPLGPAAGWLALSGYLALYPALWVWAIAGFSKRQPPVSRLSGSGGLALRFGGVLARSWARRTLWALAGAASWVAFEMALARVLGGFPWDFLGVSQYRMTPLIQIASVTGVYGVSFLVVWFSLSLLSAGLMVIRRPTVRSVWVRELFLPVLAVAILFSSGLHKIQHAPVPARTLKMTLVQPSIPQALIWNSDKDDERFANLIRLSEQALTNQTDVLVWPEAAIPRLLRYDTNTFEAVTGLARRHHVWMIVGADDAEPSHGRAGEDETDYFNSSFLINPEGKLVARYLKRNLVIFGEYIPLRHWLPFLKYFTPIDGGFTSGTKAVPFELTGLGATASVLICYEDTFPQLAPGDVQSDTDFLVNLTNDGWFGDSAAQWQQAVTGLFRAVENGVPLIRCSNNGLTCWVDAQGRLRDVFHDAQGSVYGAGFMTIDVPLPAAGEAHAQTFYNRHGDWFGWGCVGIGMLVVARRLWRR